MVPSRQHVMFGVGFITVLVLFYPMTKITRTPEKTHHHVNVLDYDEETIDNVHVTYLMPSKGVKPRGIILAFHECGEEASGFFNMPGQTRISEEAVDRELAVVAFSAEVSRPKNCWDSSYPPEKNMDIRRISNALRRLVNVKNWEILPLVAMGGGEGGQFASILAKKIDIVSLALYASVPPDAVLGNIDNHFPPTLFLSMTRDHVTVPKAVGMASDSLESAGVSVLKLHGSPKPLTPWSLTAIPKLSLSTSEYIYTALKNHGFLGNGDYIQRNPRTSNWKEALLQSAMDPELYRAVKDQEDFISERLQVHYGVNAFTEEHKQAVVAWLESQVSLFNRRNLRKASL